MKKILLGFLSIITISLTLQSCSKGGGSSSNNTADTGYVQTIDTTTYFTATFLGKTLKNTGYKWTYAGTYVTSFDLSGTINTKNDLFYHLGSSYYFTNSRMSFIIMNSGISPELQASILTAKSGNAVGNYFCGGFLNDSIPILSNSSTITDLSNSKTYNIDSTSVFKVSILDATSFQGTYTGKLIDGTTKIPVTGTFKLKKN